MTDRVGYRPVTQSSSPTVAKVRSSGGADTVQVTGTLNGQRTNFVLDSGANRTLVHSDLLPSDSLPEVPGGLCDVTGRRSTLYGPVMVVLEIGGVAVQQNVYVANNICDRVILGLDFLRQNRCILDIEKGVLCIGEHRVSFYTGVDASGDPFPPKALRVRVLEPVTVAPGMERLVRCRPAGQKFDSMGIVEAGLLQSGLMVGRSVVDPQARSFHVPVANVTDLPVRIRAGSSIGVCERVEVLPEADRQMEGTVIKTLPDHLFCLLEESSQDLSPSQHQRVRDLLSRYADVFSAGDWDMGRTSVTEHRIDTGNSRPVKVPPRRIPIHKHQEMEEAVQQLSDQGLIEPSTSPWSSALVLVRKKDGSLRCCVDYRLLNAATVKDSYPLPRIDDTLDALSGSHWFSTLDLKSGYYQVPLADKDKPKTAFSTGRALWHWRVMPFGLSNAPATFERLMDSVLAGMHWRSLLVYLDDVIVFGRTFDEELQRLEDVFRRMRSANLKLNPKKCSLFRSEVKFLGHIVSRAGIKTDPMKTAAVAEWPPPSNVRELRSFLGFCTYYRRFVRNFADIAAPLHALTKEGVAFNWSTECQDSFRCLKSALVKAPVLQYPDPSKPFILDTDASSMGIGGVLSQIHDGVERVVAYFSRTLTAPEKNYCVTRKELLAVVETIRHFHIYLYGSKFTIRSDHSALQWLARLKDPEGQLARWLARLGQYNYQVVHRPGARHTNADALSRRPCPVDCKHCCRRDETLGGTCRATRIGPITSDSTQQDIRSAQNLDTELSPLMRLLEQHVQKPEWHQIASTGRVTKLYWSQWEQLRLCNGILQRRWESSDGTRTQWLNVIPRSLRETTLKEAHGSVTSGHFGVKRTLQRLRKCCYWVGMRRDAQEWCRTCEACIRKKGPVSRSQGPLQIVSVGAPMERVAVDIAGPFPVSAAGNRYIVVLIDYFSKWPEAFPVPNQEAETVARVLVDGVFCRFGVPEEMHSDQGRNFESILFRECCQLLGVRKTRTTPLHPESDGMVERFNRTLVQEMAKRCRHGQADWDLYIPSILLAYRTAEHEATGYTPAQLMMGRDLRVPVDMLFERPPDTQPVCTAEYVKTQRDRMASIRAQTAANLKVSAETMKQRVDTKATMEPLEEGDQVWLYNPQRKKGLSPKLSSPWDGPFSVVQRLSSVTYRIRKNKNSAPKVVHFNRLWKFKGPPKFTWDGISRVPDDPTDQLTRDTGTGGAGIGPTATRGAGIGPTATGGAGISPTATGGAGMDHAATGGAGITPTAASGVHESCPSKRSAPSPGSGLRPHRTADRTPEMEPPLNRRSHRRRKPPDYFQSQYT